MSSPSERFWRKVEKSGGCWLWVASTMSVGYGQFYNGTRIVGAHRFAWEEVNGPIPDGLWVLHRCDVPLCVRPDHLFLGTASDNTADMVAKGRGRAKGSQGEANPRCRMTADDVLALREAYAAGEGSYRTLAARFGISRPHVSEIVTRRQWTHI